jgi:hypothetical protein
MLSLRFIEIEGDQTCTGTMRVRYPHAPSTAPTGGSFAVHLLSMHFISSEDGGAPRESVTPLWGHDEP